jgi:hypothetical protein
MSDKPFSNLPPEYTTIKGDKALEMVMRDVLDGMQEFASMANFSPRSVGGYEILSVEEPNAENTSISDQEDAPKADVIPLKKKNAVA